MQRLHERARALDKKIVLPEGEDPRTVQAAHWLVENRVAHPVLIGSESAVHAAAQSLGLVLPASIPIIDPTRTERTQRYAQALFQLRKHKGLSYEHAGEMILDVLYFGDMMVREGDADGCVAGAAHPSPDVIKAAIRVLGVAEGSALVSSFFLMVLPDGRPVTYADCGVNASPDASQLASIGIDAADNHTFLTGEKPLVAFLSFSTKGSADSPEVEKVREAVELANARRPDLQIDGEMQFDAAFVPSVGERKAPGSPVAGRANVYVFPDLNAGNIGYKITQRVGGAEAFGPVLQGLAKPANDLSRGSDWEDIANVAAITAIQAGALGN
ncbi:MAG: phosphate acetyltransferase [Rubricoccaceae bacterium]